MQPKPTILIADDDESIRDLLVTLIAESGYETLEAADGGTAVDLAIEHQPDVALLDVMMPGMDGFDACRAIKSDVRTADIPVLLLTALAHTPAKVEGLDCGASDYITKPFDTQELLARLRAALNEKNRLDALATEALTDPLTGLTNRRGLEQQIDQMLAHSGRTGEPLSVLMFDADRFKHINDTYGHEIGDLVLATIAHRARETMRTQDVIGRFGGEEFLAILPGAGHHAALIAAERLRAHVADVPIATPRAGIPVTVSVGVATLHPGIDDRAALVATADSAMYAAKAAGRNYVVHADGRPTGPLSIPDPPEAARALIGALALVHPAMAEHSHNVSHLCWQIGGALHLSPNERAHVALAGLLHDVGTLAVPDTLRNGNGACPTAPATDEDRNAAFSLSARAGEDLLTPLPSLGSVATIVGAQCEWWDGAGSPRGLAGEDIPFGSRIIAVADAYDNSLRNHTLTSTQERADALNGAAGSRLDPTIVAAALRVLPR